MHVKRVWPGGCVAAVKCALLGGLVAIASACAPSSSSDAALSGAATPDGPLIQVSIQERTNAAPSIAAAGDVVALVWTATAGTTSDIYSAVSRDGGRSFAAPVRVNDQPGDARASGEQPARVLLTPQRSDAPPSITVIWTTKREEGTRILFARSADGGATFSPALLVPGADGAGNRGWESAVQLDNGRIIAAWLDHRDHVAKPAAEDAPHVHGAMASSAEKSKIYAGSLDGTIGGGPIASSVCYCCKTSMAAAGDRVFVAWRHVYPGNLRDIAVAVSSDRGQTFSAPSRVSEDGWAIEGCPENGPAIVAARDGVHVVWPSLVRKDKSRLALFHATSADGTSFSPRQEIATTGSASHVQVIDRGDGHLIATWDELLDGRRKIVVSRRAPGAPFGTAAMVPHSEGGVYPVVAAVSDAVVAAWAQSGESPAAILVSRLVR